MPDPTPTTPATRPGYKTSEFYFGALAMLLTLLFASGAIPAGSGYEKVAVLAATALTSMGYSVSRGLAKGGPAASK